jgi:hypothetical protein
MHCAAEFEMNFKCFLKQWLFPTLSLTTLAVAAGCTPQPGVTTLDNMTISSGLDGSYRKPFNLNYPSQTRFLASNGLLPVSAPGEACLASAFRPASSMLCLTPGPTRIEVRKFDFNGGPDDLRKMQAALQKLELDIIDLASLDLGISNPPANTPPAQEAENAQALKAKADALITKAKQLERTFNQNNFFIFRWQGSDQVNGSGNIGTPLSGKSGATRNQSGRVIIGGLTLSNLVLGLSDAETRFSGYPKAAKIATYTMGAKHLLYFSSLDLSAALSAKFKGSGADIKALSSSTQAVINAYASIGRGYETRGAFSAVKVIRITPEQYNQQYATQHVFYSTMTDVKTLLNALKK